MKNSLILSLVFLPMTLLGQQLECCESEKEIEIYLIGSWVMKDSDLKREYHYELKDELLIFQAYLIQDNGTLEKSEDKAPTINILKTKKGFEIEHDFSGMKTYAGIKHLDSSKLTVTRQDGAEREYLKISDN